MAAKGTGTSNGTASQAEWIWDPAQQLYYSPASQTYAYPDATTGQWVYLPTSSLGVQEPAAESSQSAARRAEAQQLQNGSGIDNDREEGEIDDDVGWGGLMEPEELDKVIKTQAKAKAKDSQIDGNKMGSTSIMADSSILNGTPARYDDPSLYAYNPTRQKSPEPTTKDKETPNHILRLVVLTSPTLGEGTIGVIDAREGGVQLGRDRCEKGGQARLRVKEMEVSKTHAVVFWGKGGEEGQDEDFSANGNNEGDGHDDNKAVEGWWVVDLGSTHGTFVTHQPTPTSRPDHRGDTIDLTTDESSAPIPLPRTKRPKPHRVSEAKTASLPYQLHHLSLLTLGHTTFEAHIHPSWPCDTCQLGKGNEIALDTGESLVKPDPSVIPNEDASSAWAMAMDNKQRRDNREINRKREMAALRDTLINRRNVNTTPGQGVSEGKGDATPEKEVNKYIDRSAMRRRLHPVSPPRHSSDTNDRNNHNRYPQLPPSRTDTPPLAQAPPPPGPSAFAQSMLVSQGWTPGSGLGKDLAGRSTPIDAQMRTEKRGLGAVGSLAIRDDEFTGEGDWRQRGKMRRYEAAKNVQKG